MAISLPTAQDPLEKPFGVRLIHGDTPLLVVSGPTCRVPLTGVGLGHLQLEGFSPEFVDWEAVFQGDSSEDTRTVPGTLTGPSQNSDSAVRVDASTCARFDWTAPASWNRIRLQTLSASGQFPLGSSGGVGLSGHYQIVSDQIRWTPRGMNNLVIPWLEKAGRDQKIKNEDQVKSTDLLGSVFRIPGDRAQEVMPSIEKELSWITARRDSSPLTRHAYFDWLGPLMLAQTWTRNWEQAFPLNVSRILQPIVHIECGPVPRDFVIKGVDQNGGLQ